ncbi:PIN domain-containing protein [Bosea sp. (in: a-proteobacteria)]|uniref:PIN domain-containing protein n=1 Tax=Bosea sp. (in: a-proteobacteria) TaxID=1871050 RepID=UPI002FC64C05
MRPPSPVLIVDANIVLSCALGLRGGDVLEFVGRRRLLTISERAVAAIEAVAMRLVDGGNPSALFAPQLAESLRIVADSEYLPLVPEATKTLMLAPASRNGSSSDAHVLALAWLAEADIWSHDRDFAGTGWPSWSSANLRAALARETL